MNVPGGQDLPVETLGDAVRHTLEAEGCADAEISLTLLGDQGIRDLNRRYLDRDRVTDVIAFQLDPEDGAVLGDVYLGLEQASRQAGEAGIELVEELVRLAVHGTLHVLGWDHPEGDDRVESPHFVRQEGLVQEILQTRAAG